MDAPSLTNVVAWEAPRHCERSFGQAGLPVIARVQERSDAVDLVLSLRRLTVVRCVYRISRNDYRGLATMLAAGDFHRAAIVYTSEDQPHLSDEIESYPLSRIDELAASLARESAK